MNVGQLSKSHKFYLLSFSLQCIKALKIDRNYYVPPEYEENFRKSELVFKYQLVFDPKVRKCVQLRNPAEENTELSEEDLDYAGPYPFHLCYFNLSILLLTLVLNLKYSYNNYNNIMNNLLLTVVLDLSPTASNG